MTQATWGNNDSASYKGYVITAMLFSIVAPGVANFSPVVCIVLKGMEASENHCYHTKANP